MKTSSSEILIRQHFKSILDMGSERAVADLAVTAINDDAERFQVLLQMCFSEKYPLCMRSARALQLYCEQNTSFLIPQLEEIIPIALNADIEGVRRNFLKIFNEFIDFSLLKDSGILLNQCFEMLMNPTEKPGIRSHCLQLLYKFSLTEKDIAHELIQVLEFMEDEPEKSMKYCINKVRQKLQITHQS